MIARTFLMGTATVCVLAVVSACSFSGLDAESKFACKAPDGVVCDSMTGSLANLQAGNVRNARTSQLAAASAPTSKTPAQGAVLARPLFSGSPIRSAPHVVRAWIAPWEDADGDLHDQSYIYLTTDTGRWLVEHNQRRIRDLYRPTVGGTVAADASASPKVEPPSAAVGRRRPRVRRRRPDRTGRASQIGARCDGLRPTGGKASADVRRPPEKPRDRHSLAAITGSPP
ncbi:TraV family lipoprotein [Burkholderia ubonensis]|uniref:TraV family lipoprotein n=1 Tax=Burkholderia ubonensis TaxID=101571 RepID=UPI000A80A26F|nr:TraV family lipoprotein [Burkholderia ubonensis]